VKLESCSHYLYFSETIPILKKTKQQIRL